MIAREQQGAGLQRHPRHLDDLPRRRPAGRRAPQHGVGREEAGEHDDVAEQEDPEAVADDDPLAGRAGLAVAGALGGTLASVAAMAEAVRVLADAPDRLDAGGKTRLSRSSVTSALLPRRSARAGPPRAARRARSTRATSSAGTSNSWTSRQAKTTKPAKAPTRPSAGQPPDVPDQREADDGGEEGGEEADGAVHRHLDRLVSRLRSQALRSRWPAA